MRRWVLYAYTAAMTTLATLYFVLPDPPRYLWTVIGCTSVATIVAGTLLNRPRTTLPWWLVAAGTAAFISGDTVYDILQSRGEVSFPSPADVVYLCTYPLFASGLLLVVRTRFHERDRHALIDALIVTIGLGLLAWVFLASPYTHDGEMSVVEKGFSIAYPLGDVLLLAVLTRLLVGRGRRSWSLRLLTVGTVGLMTSDVLYGLVLLNDPASWRTGGPVDLGWIVFYTAWGAAALHPDMARLTEPVRSTPQVLSRGRLFLLGSASLVPPAVLIVGSLRHDVRDVIVNAVASGAIFVLVTVRLSGLVHVARQSTQREHVLRRTGEQLVGASDREEIYSVSARAISALTHSVDSHRVLIAVGANDRPRLVHDTAVEGPERLRRLTDLGDLGDLVERHGDALRVRSFVLTSSDHAGTVLRTRLGPGVPVLLAALLRSGSVAGVVAVSGADVERTDIIDAVCAMGAQMVLALEGADLTEQVLQRKNEAHFRSLIQNTSDMILVVDADLTVGYHTPSVEVVLGHPPEQVAGRSVLELLSAQDEARASLFLQRVRSAPARARSAAVEPDDEWRLLDAEGQVRAFEVTCSNLLEDPFVRGLVLTLHDTTERRALEDELKHLAFHDSLTELANRTLFLDRVEHALARRGRHQERLAVMLIDLDDFKMVNDTRGHAAGDALLVAVTERLGRRRAPRGHLRPAGRGRVRRARGGPGLGRGGGAARRTHPGRPPSALRLPGRRAHGAREHRGLHQPVRRRLRGAADAGRPGDVRRQGRGQGDVRVLPAERFRTSWPPGSARCATCSGPSRMTSSSCTTSRSLDLGTGRVVGTEALVRWHHPERGLVLPGEFIDVVEQGDLAVPLGSWVIDTAVAQAAAWQPASRAEPPVRMNVNVAPRQLADPGFVDDVTRSLRKHGLDPSVLVLEITERTLTAQEPQIIRAMHRLKELGIGLAVDDFGTGYAALGYLPPVPGHHPQDRPLLRQRRRQVGRRPSPGRGDRPAGRDVRPRPGRRGHRDRQPARSAAGPGVRPGSGVPLRPRPERRGGGRLPHPARRARQRHRPPHRSPLRPARGPRRRRGPHPPSLRSSSP